MENSVTRIVQLSQIMSDTQKKLNELQKRLDQGKRCFNSDIVKQIEQYITEFPPYEAKFKETLLKLVKDVRSGNKDAYHLESFIATEQEGAYSALKFSEKENSWEVSWSRLRAMDRIEKEGVIYVGNGDYVDTNKDVYILYTQDILSHGPQTAFFWKLYRDLKDSVGFSIVDQSPVILIGHFGVKEATFLDVLIFSKFISAEKLFGITLLILSAKPVSYTHLTLPTKA